MTLASDVALHIAATPSTSLEDLLRQPFVKNADLTASQLLIETSNILRERISIVKFVRWQTELERPSRPEPPHSPANVAEFKNQA